MINCGAVFKYRVTRVVPPVLSRCGTGLVLGLLLSGTCHASGIDGTPTAKGAESQEVAPTECVVLLHGMGRTNRSMNDMERGLQRRGYLTSNIDYPSTSHKVEELAEMAIPKGVEQCRKQGADTIHFVTHSLGGIVTRYYLSGNVLDELGKVVMLSPPNKGSEVTDALGEMFFYKTIFGPAGQQLGTGEDSFVNKLGPVHNPVGVIIGNESAFFDSYFSDVIPGEDDGKVSVERAKVEGMSDFLVLPYTHPYIMAEDEVIRQTAHFLKNGSFFEQPKQSGADPRDRKMTRTRTVN